MCAIYNIGHLWLGASIILPPQYVLIQTHPASQISIHTVHLILTVADITLLDPMFLGSPHIHPI